jgi:SAM-dependent methyltransferase
MSLVYRILYRVGFTPWDRDPVPAELAALVEGPGALPAGEAMDIGCGTGSQAVYLARHGWRVTGVDAVPQALREARDRATAAGVEVEWIKADVGRMGELFGERRFTLFHDRGCYHGLPAKVRDAYARGIAASAAPQATFLLMAFAPNRGVGPSGADEAEIRARFADWRIVSVDPDTGPAPSGPLAKVPRLWYRLERGA